MSRHISYAELHREVSLFANVLKAHGVQKGDRVTIYLPMIPEVAYAMLACARIGAVHSVVFAGFSPDSLAGRIQDCGSELVITADEGLRGGKERAAQEQHRRCAHPMPERQAVIVVKRTGASVNMSADRDVWYHDEMLRVSATTARPKRWSAEDPLFILYTSGSTGKPKGVLHTSARLSLLRRVHAQIRLRLPRRRYLLVHGRCRLGHGPQLHCLRAARERRDDRDVRRRAQLSDASRFWEVIDKHKVNIFYTAPTAIRALMREGEEPVKKTSRASLRLLGTVGEPINPEAWLWYHRVVGDGRCPIVDTWWQTETGGILISPLPGATDLKPGSATKPLPGIVPAIVDAKGKISTAPAAAIW